MTLNKLLSFTLLACISVLTACRDFDGNLHVNSDMALVESRDHVQIAAGDYRTTVQIIGKKKIQVSFKIADTKHDFTFKTAQNLKELNSGDQIEILSKDSGQPVDALGQYNVSVDRSPLQRGTESCTYQEVIYDCWDEQVPQTCRTITECNPRAPGQCKERTVCEGGGWRRVCGNRSITRSGYQEVEYYSTTTTRTILMSMLDQARTKELAKFGGNDYDTQTHYTFRGICR